VIPRFCSWPLFLLIILLCSLLLAQDDRVPTPADLAAVTQRGRSLAEYDIAIKSGGDVIRDLAPDNSKSRYYIASKTEAGWQVVAGSFNSAHSQFLEAFQARQGTSREYFTAKRLDPPVATTGFYFHAARAFDLALKDFGALSRPYNFYAIPAAPGQLYVYLLPAQTTAGIYPLGGDVRYTFSADGAKMLDKRPMHKKVLDFDMHLPDKVKAINGGAHSHVMSLSPEDSDVFYVLTRKPSVPEYVRTLDKKIYRVNPDGTIGLEEGSM
jgi:hypothetical protein